MIVDVRIYTCKPGKVPEFLALYEKEAWPFYQKYLGRCVGFYATVDGELNTVMHQWAFDNAGDREQRRAKLNADPEFKEFLKKLSQSEMLTKMENRIMKPVDFWQPGQA